MSVTDRHSVERQKCALCISPTVAVVDRWRLYFHTAYDAWTLDWQSRIDPVAQSRHCHSHDKSLPTHVTYNAEHLLKWSDDVYLVSSSAVSWCRPSLSSPMLTSCCQRQKLRSVIAAFFDIIRLALYTSTVCTRIIDIIIINVTDRCLLLLLYKLRFVSF